MTDPVLVVAWLVLAHLIADFVLQNDWIALNKGNGGRTGNAALLAHGGHVALCLLPAVAAFGLPGLVYLVLVVASHMAVDRWKVLATRRAVAIAQAQARRRLEAMGRAPGSMPGSPLGSAWTPIPGLLFLADQVLHLTIAIVGWLVILAGASLIGPYLDAVNNVLRDWDRSAVHATMLTGVVLVSLFIANTRGAFYFVLSLVTPREIAAAQPELVVATPGAPVAAEPAPAPQPEPAPSAQPGPAPGVPSGAAARVGTTIAALERLLIVGLLLGGASIVIGFLILADTIARARQLEDRTMVEYHLLGLLASLLVALGTGLVAQAALSTLG
jgi:hypothetical protein